MKKQFLVAGLLLCLFSANVNGQGKWGIKPSAIRTRWAKEVSPARALPEYPRPQLVRSNWTNLNGLWEYAITDKTVSSVNSYEGKILVPFPIESSLSGVKKSLQPEQLLWYKRRISKPILKTGERVLLHFGAVDFEATVYLNGKEIGNHKGGYQNFSFDVTGALKAGSNELTVKVWDPSDQGPNPHGKQVLNPGGIMYTPSSGIWQTVWMETVPASYIEGLTIRPDVDKKQVTIKVNATRNKPVTLLVDGKTVKGKSNTEIAIPLNDPKLWSPDDPYLYDLTVSLGTDKVKSYFGMRKIEVKKDKKGIDRIFLNNKYTYNLGTLDQGFWPDGLYTAPTDEALAFDIKAIKAMGFNTIRKHIKIEPERWYYYTDKLGMLVWQDMVNPGNDKEEGHQEFEKECKENVAQLYNHPSITTWVLFNEKWGQYDQQRLTKWMKAEDPTRLINGHSGEMLYVNDQLRSPSPDAWAGADMTDVHAYPMPGHIQSQPGKARVLGEFGGIGVPVEGHLWDDLVSGWGYDGVVTPNKMKQQYSQMVDSLKVLEQQGLSASIYTQPFDVESEQNGLMTYDREVIKLPVETIRSINEKLWPNTENLAISTKGVSVKIANPNGSEDYQTRLKAYQGGKRDSAFLRSLAIMAQTNNDAITVIKASGEYIEMLRSPLFDANIKFIAHFTKNTKSPGFRILFNNIDRVSEVLGEDMGEAYTTKAIEADEITPYVKKGTRPDWTAMEQRAVIKYGNLGQESVWQTKVFYSVNHKDWETFSQALTPYLEKYGYKRVWLNSDFINRMAWTTFENSNNRQALEAAATMAAEGLKQKETTNLLDTYANLLYKLGRTDEALKWEQKAVASSKGDLEIKGNYEKMKRGEATWPN